VAVNVGIGVDMEVLAGSIVGTTEEVGVSTEVLTGVDLPMLSNGEQAEINNNKMRVAKLFFINFIYIL
jgi:hypothetical protein